MEAAELITKNAQAERLTRGAWGISAALSLGSALGMAVRVYRGTSLVKAIALGVLANGLGIGAMTLAMRRQAAVKMEWAEKMGWLGWSREWVDEAAVATSLPLFPEGYKAVNIDLSLTSLATLRKMNVGQTIEVGDMKVDPLSCAALVILISLFPFGAAVIGRLAQGWRRWQSLAALAPFSATSLAVGGLWSLSVWMTIHNTKVQLVEHARSPVVLAELDRLDPGALLSKEDRAWLDGKALSFGQLNEDQFAKLMVQLHEGQKRQSIVIGDSSLLTASKLAQVLQGINWNRGEELTLIFWNSRHLPDQAIAPPEFERQAKVKIALR